MGVIGLTTQYGASVARHFLRDALCLAMNFEDVRRDTVHAEAVAAGGVGRHGGVQRCGYVVQPLHVAAASQRVSCDIPVASYSLIDGYLHSNTSTNSSLVVTPPSQPPPRPS